MSTNNRGEKGGDIYYVKHEAGKQVFSLWNEEPHCFDRTMSD